MAALMRLNLLPVMCVHAKGLPEPNKQGCTRSTRNAFTKAWKHALAPSPSSKVFTGTSSGVTRAAGPCNCLSMPNPSVTPSQGSPPSIRNAQRAEPLWWTAHGRHRTGGMGIDQWSRSPMSIQTHLQPQQRSSAITRHWCLAQWGL
jgi:hypothetical protein